MWNSLSGHSSEHIINMHSYVLLDFINNFNRWDISLRFSKVI